MQIEQFIGLDKLDPALLEKPYFVTPQNDSQAEAFAVVRKALLEQGKVGLGRISASGRERLLAVSAPQDNKFTGMMAYVLRYPEELRSAQEYFAGIKTPAVDNDQLSLAKELIKRKTAKFQPEKFKDKYEVALRALIDSKIQHTPLPKEQEPARPKVVNLMDALRRSVSETGAKKPVAPARMRRSQEPPPNRSSNSSGRMRRRRRGASRRSVAPWARPANLRPARQARWTSSWRATGPCAIFSMYSRAADRARLRRRGRRCRS